MASRTSLGNILIVDDDVAVTDLLCLNLRSEGYNVNVITDTASVVLTDLRGVHLVLIDGAGQSPSGIELISMFKATPAGQQTGFIYYSTFDSERSLIDSLDAGADDSVCKPFSLREMLARIRAVMRRRVFVSSKQTESMVVNIGSMRVDMERKSVTIDNEPVNLSNTEYAILELLLHNVNVYTSRIEIFRKIWSEGSGNNERIVDTNISRLRRKLGKHGACIVNRTGLGYMISA